MILQISVDAKEFMQAVHRCWQATQGLLKDSQTNIIVEKYANIRHHTRKNKYRQDLIMILQISADAKEFMRSEHRCWRATSEYEKKVG